jgi:hypothetical protein
MRSGVNSTPESRDTFTAGSRGANAALGNNMACSIRHGVSEGGTVGTGASGEEKDVDMGLNEGDQKRVTVQKRTPVHSSHPCTCSVRRCPHS